MEYKKYKDYQDAFKYVLPDKALDDKIMNYMNSDNEVVIQLDTQKPSKKKAIIIAAAVIGVAIISLASIPLFFNSKLNNIQRADISNEGKDNTAANPNIANSDYTNIAIFGIDTRDTSSVKDTKPDDYTRSDTTMLISINNKSKKINAVSFYRDNFSYVDGYGNPDSKQSNADYTKLCHSYLHGSYECSIKTLNENYDLNIDKFIVFNFNSFVKIADLLGGLDVNITSKDMVNSINKYGSEAAHLYNDTFNNVVSTGTQQLDGYQLLGYVRTRKIDSDINRAERQREVVSGLFEKAKKIGLSKCNDMLDIAADNVLTNLTNEEIISLISNVINYDFSTSKGFPYNHYSEKYKDLYYTFSESLLNDICTLHSDLYPEVTYTPSARVKELSSYIDSVKPINRHN